MHILYLHRTQGQGVEGVHVGEIVESFRRLGHRVSLVSPAGEQLAQGTGPAGQPSRRQRLFRAISRHVPELIFECLELAYNLQALHQAKARFGPDDVDMIFERYAIFGVAGALLARQWNKPLLVEVNYTSRSPLVRHRSALLKPLARYLDRRLFARAAGLAAVSSRLKDQLVEDYGVPPEKVIVLPNAADPEVFDPARIAPRPLPEGKTVGFVGGFYPWHGLDLLVSAMQRVMAQVQAARLVLIGDGPMLPVIRERVRAAGLEERVLFTGRVPHGELPAYIAAFHVGVMPDSNDYGSPMKIFEYMAMGKPVVVPDYPPLLDVVRDGREGRIFRARDVQQLAQCLTTLLSDDDAYRRMSREARRRIEGVHNWRANACAILDLLVRTKAPT